MLCAPTQTGPPDDAVLLDLAMILSTLDTDAERLLVLDMLGQADEEASSAYVDDLKLRVSSPWAAGLACSALSCGASHLGIVYECGAAGKTTVSLEGIPKEAADLAPLLMHSVVQHGTPYFVSISDDNDFLGVPDGLPPLRSDETVQRTPAAANQAVRLRILRKISRLAAVALRVAAVQALRCPWPLVARRFYLARAEAKVSFLLPFVIGVQVAGARLVNIQARWALSAITGRTAWPHDLKVPTALRRQLCADLGWECLLATCKASAVSLYMKLGQDDPAFAHTRLAASHAHAPGGWMTAARRLISVLRLPPWQPEHGCSVSARKASLARHRREAILPLIRAAQGSSPANPPLPWLWIASHAGTLFSRAGFELWWHLRVLGQSYPVISCPWCDQRPPLTAQHLMQECCTFAEACWTRGVQPEAAFLYPQEAGWFSGALGATDELVKASAIARQLSCKHE